MKKSYLALGLVAAVAMSSCSNDEPMPNNGNGNQNLAQGYEPVKLSMTNSFADVEVSGARTRGTGTVGSMDESKNLWQHEDIYVLMTSTQTREHNGEKTPTWGFTSALGNGPFLFEQFDGSFWARPTTSKSENEKNVSVLDYTIDRNEWWWGGSIDRFYPVSGASQFFAYHIDDAVDQNALADVKVNDEEGNAIGRERSHQYPALTMNEANNAYSVKFDLDGSQDLMAGYAPIPTDQKYSYAIQDKGFSARSARQGAVPQITMNHLLSRLTFEVVKGGENFDRVTLQGIEVVSKHKGDMVVAINPNFEAENPWENVGKITWAEGEGSTEAFALKQVADKYIVDENGKVGTYTEDHNTEVYYNIYDGLYANVKNVTSEDVIIAEPDQEWTEEDANNEELLYSVDGTEYLVKYNNENQQFYYTKETITITKTTLNEEQVEGLTNNPAAETSLKAGKAKLVDFAAVDLKDFALTKNDTKTVGEAMFVAPGVSEYTLTLKMAYLVRDGEAEELATLEQALAVAEAEVYAKKRELKVAQAIADAKVLAQETAKQNFDAIEAQLLILEDKLTEAQKELDNAEDALTIAQATKDNWEAEEEAVTAAREKVAEAQLAVDEYKAETYTPAEQALNDATAAVEAAQAAVVAAEEALADALAAEQSAKDNLAKFEPVVEEMTQDLTVKLPEGGQFTAGKSYNIRITIYGYEPAEVEVSLTPWKDGGHFDVGGDDDDIENGDYYEDGTHKDDEDEVVEG